MRVMLQRTHSDSRPLQQRVEEILDFFFSLFLSFGVVTCGPNAMCERSVALLNLGWQPWSNVMASALGALYLHCLSLD